ncbi:MAG: LysM peptidoglycan-binding domain-containing M23 family metallopeptidase [Candidatus Falkowbacteria bacterium]|nr:LysM peptidoglycan-binding domain-containing M23 family metallopeptidase [Candidatus Falkowbacteria bacterium]
MKKIQDILISLFLAIVKLFSAIVNGILFALRPIGMIGKVFLRVIFYQFIVKVYRIYLDVVNKLGWAHFTRKSVFSVFGQKTLHMMVAILTISIMFNNLIAKAQVQTINTNDASQTILSQLISSEFSGVEDQQLIEEFFDQEAFISSLHQSYLENLSAVREQPIVDSDSLDVAQGDEDQSTDGADSLPVDNTPDQLDVSDVPVIPAKKRTEVIKYVVLPGETISSIAKKFNVTISTILWENKLNAYSVIKPGDELDVLPRSGVSYKEGHRITQYYSWRHTGLDIANKIGTPLYAAEAGVVEYVGWGKGYGNQVVINHGGGKMTRYAHASKVYVKKGQKVARGEAVAAMGSTGWSTGPHIHFEVIINGVKYNPLNYIK